MNKRSSYGFTVVELALAVVIVGLVGLVSYKVYNTQKENDKIANNTDAVLEQTPVSSITVPANIKSSSDLDKAEKALTAYDSTSSDSSDLSQLDSELGAF